MAYSIKFLSLQKAELLYEVELRGGSGDSVLELRKQIVKLVVLQPSEDILESHLDPSDDLEGVQESLVKSLTNIKSIRQKFDKNLFLRTEAILNHIYHRLNRIQSTPNIAEQHTNQLSNFNSQYRELSSYRPQMPNPASSFTTAAATAGPAPELVSSNIAVTCDRHFSSDIYKLKFNGKSCVRSFIQKVEEFVLSRGLSYEKILSLAFELFVDDALHWYRCNKDRINTWNDLCTLLKEDFSSSDYDYKLVIEIQSRTQGENENIIIYTSIMQGMFSRLDRPLSEENKLEILLHNIRPCYASTLAASPGIKTIDALKSACRHYETIQDRFSQFHEPPRVTSNTLAPEFAYKPTIDTGTGSKNKIVKEYSNRTYSNYSANYNNTPRNLIQYGNKEIAVNSVTVGPSRPLFCVRCRINDHTLGNCKEEHFPICFKCGKKDVIFPNCAVCNPSKTDSKN